MFNIKGRLNYLFEILSSPRNFTIFLAQKNIIKINDEKFLKLLYRKKTGKELNLDNPQTFNEKIQWLKLHDKKEIYTTMVDKYDIKEYVANIIGKKYIIPTIGLYNSFDDIDFSKLPNQFVIKCTHDSGGICICKDKKSFDFKRAKQKINKRLKKNFYYNGREWPYKNIKPKIIIEKYMQDKNSNELIDYKILCFNGEPKLLFTCTDRYTDGLKVTWFDLNWNKLPFERHYQSSNKNINKPINFNKMIELSRKMVKNIPFVRIDWYEINGKLYFGEYTFYPGNGFEEFRPEIWDKKLGDMLDLSVVDKNEK